MFDRLSVKTMRYVTAVPKKKATGLTKRVYDMIEEDFFINGSLTSRSRVPNLMAAIWASGRETMLVDDHLDRTTKEAICGVLSDLNDCPYCGDMLISLVDAGKKHDAASAIYKGGVGRIENPRLREQLAWVQAVGTSGPTRIPPCPFTPEELPEVLGSLMAMADINRFSHVVMDGSPVNLPFGLQRPALRMFGKELEATKVRSAKPGRALDLLPAAELPDDMRWAAPNSRIADSLARWAAAVEKETAGVIPTRVRELVEINLRDWQNEEMPLSRSWVEAELGDLEGEDRAIARLALLLAKAPHQVSEEIVEGLATGGEQRFVRILAWAAFAGARRFGAIVADSVYLADESATPNEAERCEANRVPRIAGWMLVLSLFTAACDSTELPTLSVQARSVSQDTATIVWNRVKSADGYMVYRDGREVALAGPNELQRVEAFLQPGREYRYRVVAVRVDARSGPRKYISREGKIRVRTEDREDWRVESLDVYPHVSSLVIEPDGTRHMLHVRLGGGLVQSTERDGVRTTTTIGQGTRPDLVLGPDGELSAVFEQAGALWAARNSESSWSTELVDPGPLERNADIELAAAADGALHVAYSVRDVGLRHATNESGSWFAETIGDPPGVRNPVIARLAIVVGERVRVLALSGTWLNERVRQPDGWQQRGVAHDVDGGFDTALDARGMLHVAYYDRHSVRYLAWDETGYAPETVEASEGERCRVSLAIDEDGSPRLAYFGGAGGLRYAARSGGAWKTAAIDPDTDPCRELRMSVDTDGVVDILYSELGGGKLRRFRGRPVR